LIWLTWLIDFDVSVLTQPLWPLIGWVERIQSSSGSGLTMDSRKLYWKQKTKLHCKNLVPSSIFFLSLMSCDLKNLWVLKNASCQIIPPYAKLIGKETKTMTILGKQYKKELTRVRVDRIKMDIRRFHLWTLHLWTIHLKWLSPLGAFTPILIINTVPINQSILLYT